MVKSNSTTNSKRKRGAATATAASSESLPLASTSSKSSNLPSSSSTPNLLRSKDDDQEQNGMELPEDDDDPQDEDEEDEEDFPEIQFGSDSEEDQDEDEDEDEISSSKLKNGKSSSHHNGKGKGKLLSDLLDEDEDEDEESGDGDDESEGLVDSQEDDEDEESELYDSEDIDNWDEEKEDAMASDLASKDLSPQEIQEELSRMVSRATVKTSDSPEKLTKLGLLPSQSAPTILPRGRNPDGSSSSTWIKSSITSQPKRVYPSIEPTYDSDSSTEDAPNRIGNVPIEWYDDLPHIGYSIDGKKVIKPARGDELDRFLETVDDPDSWKSVEDRLTGQNVKLSSEELDIIKRLQNGEVAEDGFDMYEEYTDWFTGEGKTMETALTGAPEPKRRFIPSKWEHKKIMKIVRAIRSGRILPRAPSRDRPEFYNLWSASDEPRADHPMNMPAPKLALPGHAESYNPPAEYLFSAEERSEWESAEKEDRKTNFLPQKHSNLRSVPGYADFVQERFERCLDLYLAPRTTRKKLDSEILNNPDVLLPKLPSPKDLKPFPQSEGGMIFRHPEGIRCRCLAPSWDGNWLLTGAEDGKVRLWDMSNGRMVNSWDLNLGRSKDDKGPVQAVEWCPRKDLSLFAASTAGRIVLIAPAALSPTSHPVETSPSFLFASSGYQPPSSEGADKASATSSSGAKWVRPSDTERKLGIASMIVVEGLPKQVTWHSKGDYLCSVINSSSSNSSGSKSVLLHQISKQRSQAPFRKAGKGSSVQKVLFHPTKPQLFVATQKYVRIYDLSAQNLIKTLQTGLKWISSLSLHSSGDHLIIGSYDRKLLWFDLDLSNRPYKTLRYHSRAIRNVAFSKSFPLFTSVSDDGNVHIFHSTVYSEFDRNPLIVPLKVLRGHAIVNGLGVLDAKWCGEMPWLVTAGADGDARLWTT